jgi:hopanoid biosynthesis associated RND transporter like protein HpnN
MKALSPDSFLARLLGKLATAICRYPRFFFWPQVLLFLASIAYTAGFLQFDMDQNNLVSGSKRYHHNFLEFEKEFPQPDDLVVVVQSESVEKNRQFVERLGARMEAETNLFQNVFYKGDLSVMGPKALLLAPEADLVGIRDALSADLPFIQQFSRTTNLVSFFEQINTQFRTARRQQNAQTDSLMKSLPVLGEILRQGHEALEREGTPPPPDVASFFSQANGADNSAYITFSHGKIFLITAHPPPEAVGEAPPVLGTLLKNAVLAGVFHQPEASGDLTGDAIDRLRQLIAETRAEVPGVNVGLTGQSVLDYDQMAQSQKDTTLASVVSLMICAFIFIYGYNETGRPVKALICLVVGLVYTLAFATCTVGHLNVLTITFLPMLIGLAIDFGVHLITRYEEELRHGREVDEAMRKAMVFTGQGIFMGALTTAGAFLAMAFTNFKGIREMGIICGGGLMICLVPMLTILPVLLLRGRQNVIDHQTLEDDRRARIESVWLKRPLMVTAVIIAVSVLAATQWHKVEFDYNLMDLQSPSLPSVVYAKKLAADKSLLVGEVVADNVDEAVALEKKIRMLTNVVDDVQSAAGYLHQEQVEKLKLISQIKQIVAPLQFEPADTRPVDIYALSSTLYSLYGYLGAARADIGNSDPELAKQFLALQSIVEGFRTAMLAGDENGVSEHADKLAEFQQGLFDALRETFVTLENQDDSAPLRVEDLPPALSNRFIGVHGKFLLEVFPKKDIWERANQEEFVEALRHALDPQDTNHPIITGTPVQLFEYESLLKDSYISAAWYSLIAIALIVMIHFRSLVAVVLALIPVGLGTLWLAGLMGWLKMPFNPANIMTLPLVIGIGVTNGIHILNRFAEERTPGILARSTGKAVLVSGLTAIAGFGSLILAKHQGIHSLGVIMAIGIATCMIAGLTFVPALLNLFCKWLPLIKKPGANKKSSAPGSEEPR